jgi:Sugar phosphate isomerases/epimerases
MKLCFSTLGCPDWTLEQIAENGEKTGFQGVELRTCEDGHVNTGFSKEKRKQVRALFAAHQLKIVCISGYTKFCGDDAATLRQNGETLVLNAELARDLGAPYIRTFPGADAPFSAAGTDALRYYADKVHALGVTALMETHDAISTGAGLKKLLDTVNSPGLAALFDIHHPYRNGEMPEETLSQLGSAIRHVHIKDADTAHKLCHMGEGDLPVPHMLHLLKQSGYDGFLSFEWEKMWKPELDGPEIAFPKYITYMLGTSMDGTAGR